MLIIEVWDCDIRILLITVNSNILSVFTELVMDMPKYLIWAYMVLDNTDSIKSVKMCTFRLFKCYAHTNIKQNK